METITCLECRNQTLWHGVRPEQCQSCGVWLPPVPFREAKRQWERSYCDLVLRIAKGNVAKAAVLAGKDRKDFYSVLQRNDLDPNDYRPPAKARH